MLLSPQHGKRPSTGLSRKPAPECERQMGFGSGTGAPHHSSIPYGYLVNVTTGEEQPHMPAVDIFAVASAGRIVANDGTAVFSDRETVVILQDGQIRRIPTQNHDSPGEAV